MKITSPLFNSAIELKTGKAFSLVIENKTLFRSYVQDLYNQMAGIEGKIVLSENDAPIDIQKNIEIVNNFLPFDINTKPMLNGICSALEKRAVNEENYLKTAKLLADIENYITDLSFDLPFKAECGKLSYSSLIKSLQVHIANDYETILEEIIDYMALILEFNNKKLFVFVNFGAYFSEDEIVSFIKTAEIKMFNILFIESCLFYHLQGVERLIIDNDLCEI